MTTEPRSAKDVFVDLIGTVPPDQWDERLAETCQGNVELQRRVRALLRAHVEPGSFLEEPAMNNATILQEPALVESAGTVIGPYKLLQQIGEGGMGVVFMAEQTEPIQRTVALKIIKPGMDTRQVIARFEAERQALAMMDHPNIARVLDAGATDSGRPYFVMDLVKGLPITDYCDQQHLPVRERLKLMSAVCQAVQHAHQKGVIHRDLKPTNVLVAEYDGKPVPKVIDFGVAKATAQRLTEKSMFTELGQMVGTVEYMSPEQARFNQIDVDTRSDIYSLGVLLYELLTGSTPFGRKRLNEAAFDEMLRIIREEEPPTPSARLSSTEGIPSIAANRGLEPLKLNRLVQGELDWIVMKCLEKDRGRRYESANRLAEDVQHYLNDEPVEACPPSTIYKFRKLARRNRAVLTAIAAILIALMAGVVGTSWQAMRATRQRNRAIVAEEVAQAEAVRATEEADRAEQQHLIARRNQYNAEMVAGETEIANQNQGGLYARLVDHLPVEGEEDYRDWEWYYLMSRCRPEIRTLAYPGRSPFAACSPDGQLIGAPGAIWRADTGERIRRFNTSRSGRYRCAWSPDGTKFAWGMTADENSFYIWDRSTNSVNRFPGHKTSVLAVAWSPDGSRIASSSHDQTIKIWDVATNMPLWTSPVQNYAAMSLDWSPDGELLAAGVHWTGVQMWDVLTHQKVIERTTRGVILHSVSWHPDGNMLAVSDDNSWFLLARDDWSVQHRQELSRGGNAIAFSPDGSQIAVAHGESVTVWDSKGNEVVAEFNGHLAPVVSVSWSPDGRSLVTGDESKTIKLWDLEQREQPPRIETHTGGIQSVAWLDDDQTVVSIAEADGSSIWWDTRNGLQLRREDAVLTPPFDLSRDRRFAASHLLGENAILILDASSGVTRSTLQFDPTHKLLTYALSSDGSHIAIHAFEGSESFLDFWKIDQEQVTGTWSRDRPYVNDWSDRRLLTWEKAGTRMAAVGVGDSGTDHLQVFDAAQGRLIFEWNPEGSGTITSLAWSEDGHFVSLGTSEGRIEVLDIKERRRQFDRKLHRHGISALAWHPDGNRLACATLDGWLKLVTGTEGSVLLSFSLPEGQATKLEWSSNGQTLAAATSEGHIHIWDASRAHEFSANGPRRGELAWMYFDRAQQSSGEVAEAALREFLRHAPDTLDFWEARGTAFANLGDFERAADEFSKAIEPDIQYAFGSACFRAYAMLAARDFVQYHETCARLVDAFHESLVPSNQGLVAWLCALTPDQRVDAKQLVKMATFCCRDPDNEGDNQWVLCLAATLYRDGQSDAAVRMLTELADRLEQRDAADKWKLACTKYFLSLARFDMGRVSQARQLLEEANRTAEKYHRDASDWYWMNPIALDTLRREAEARLNGNGTGRLAEQDAGTPAHGALRREPDAQLNRERTDQLAQRDAAALATRVHIADGGSPAQEPSRPDKDAAKLKGQPNIDRTALALQALSDALEQAPRDRALWTRRARLYAEQESWDKAAADWIEVIKLSEGTRFADSPRNAACRVLAGWPEVFNRVAELLPEEPALWIGRAQYRALRSQWAAASSDYARVVPSRPVSSETFEYAGTLLLSGDTEGYQRFCTKMAEHRDPSRIAYSYDAYVLARTCSIGPAVDVDPQLTVDWATLHTKNDGHAWVVHVLGLALYRAGKFDLAIENLEKSNNDRWGELPKAQNSLVLAMVHHRLGNDNEAQECLERAQVAIEAARPKYPDEPVDVTVAHWIALEVLRREAEELLQKNHNNHDEKPGASGDAPALH